MSLIHTLFQDYRLTTAEIIYHLPDYPELLQSFIWQSYDLPPDFPKLIHFLDFWQHSIEGKLHSIKVAYADPVQRIHFADINISYH